MVQAGVKFSPFQRLLEINKDVLFISKAGIGVHYACRKFMP